MYAERHVIAAVSARFLTMAIPEPWRRQLRDLMAASASRGYVTYDELSQRLAGIEADPAALEAALGMLEAAHVELVDSQPLGKPGPSEEAVPAAQDGDVPDIVAAYQRDLARVEPLAEEAQRAIGAKLQRALEALQGILDELPSTASSPAPVAWRQGSAGDDAPTPDVSSLYERAVALERCASNRDCSESTPGLNTAIAARIRQSREALDDAREQLVRGTMRLVFYLARHYENRGVELLDLVQEGNAGLLRAAQRFDPRRGHPFASYATWWIRHALAKAVREQGKSFKIPPELDSQIHRLNLERRRQSQALGREPSTGELASALGVDESHVTRLLRMVAAPLRLDGPAGEADGSLEGVLDAGADDTGLSVADQAILKTEVARVLETLDPREQEVMRLRFGIADGVTKPIEEVAALLRMTRERGRQIEERALRKLRHPTRRHRLEGLD
ncbi:sigma-70 family RNA polymerase sigma factor [Candidatus Fermentibacteria bacterium]|nr:sigma-70 family RNA polymerase sigma factor [Candidatus Fermentibacteria bacterium]